MLSAEDARRPAGIIKRDLTVSEVLKSYICPECLSGISFIQKPYCRKCGKQLLNAGATEMSRRDPHTKEAGVLCRDCAKKERSFQECRCLAVYDEVMQEILTDIKYRGKREFVRLLGLLAAEHLGAWISEVQPDAFVPVPVHPERQKKRGYNQAELFAEELSRALYHTGRSGSKKITVASELLVRRKNTTAQKELNAEQRLMNLQGAFTVPGKLVNHPHLMIVDDIYTTGSTLNACSEALLAAGASEVYGFCMAAGTDIG